jgi:predicted peptidase
VANGCWGDGRYFDDAVKQKYPSFYVVYQECDSDEDGARFSDIIDTAIKDGWRIDINRIYLTGWSKGGSASYKLVRGFLEKGKLFAGIIRVAGQSETELPDAAVEKTSIWYHIGLDDSDVRVQVARDAYKFVKDHPSNKTATESTETDKISATNSETGSVTEHNRTTKTLTKNDVEIMKLTEYEGLGHDATAHTYADPNVFAWLFGQSLTCR